MEHKERSIVQLYQAMHLSKGNNLYYDNAIYFYQKVMHPFSCITLALFSVLLSLLLLMHLSSYHQFFMAIIAGIMTYLSYAGINALTQMLSLKALNIKAKFNF